MKVFWKKVLIWYIVYFGGFLAAKSNSYLFLIPLILCCILFWFLTDKWFEVKK
jgi:hypothetical protein